MKIFGDRVFALIVISLIVGGAAMFLSAALGLLAREGSSIGHLALTQLMLGLVPGVIALVLLRFSSPTFIQKCIPAFYIASILLTLLVFIPGLGVHTNGASRWIAVGPLTVQPAEFLKLSVVLMFALYLSKTKEKLKDLRYGLGGFGVIVGIPALILLAQPNTSTTLIIGASCTALYFLARGFSLRDFGILLAVAVIGLGALVATRPYLMHRVTTFLDPSHDALGKGYQIQQSLIAIGSGGLLGRGFGQSVQKFNYLPEPVGDSIFAVFGEEFGFLGTVFLVLLFTMFAARGFTIAAEASNAFGTFAAAGLTMTITVSAFMNIGAMLSILPLTGLPLPFISHGGTALLAALASVGVILNVAAHRTKKRAAHA
ncbi:MAG: Cell division protein FtsW [Parcubacteria group bacterium]|nr:Cell division protein FtsW [Parcubacteria group bacterium]